jgi:thiol peroxidase
VRSVGSLPHMAQTMMGGKQVRTVGELPAIGTPAPPFVLTTPSLTPLSSDDLAGQTVVLNIFPSIDTRTCAASVREFNRRAGAVEGTTVVNVSADLPFAQGRFCGAEGLDGVRMGSTFRGSDVLDDYGVRLLDGRFEGLAARAVVVIDPRGVVVHSQLVPDIGQEPDYDAALAAIPGVRSPDGQI